MLKGKLDLLSNTNMVDFAMDVHRSLYPDQEVPQSRTRFILPSTQKSSTFISHLAEIKSLSVLKGLFVNPAIAFLLSDSVVGL